MNIDKCEMPAPRQKLICVSTHIVNLWYNGAGRSDEYVCALKNQMLPAASDGYLRHRRSNKVIARLESLDVFYLVFYKSMICEVGHRTEDRVDTVKTGSTILTPSLGSLMDE